MTDRPTTAQLADRWPRGLRRQEAAKYVGLSASKFDELVDDGRMPRPVRIDGCVRWDRQALDDAFDALSDQAESVEFAA